MMLCGASSLCHAQEVKFEYDEAGNLVKRFLFEYSEDYSVDENYRIKITFSPHGEKMNVKFYDACTGNVVDCRIQMYIRPLYFSGTSPSMTYTYVKGDFNIDISSFPSDFYALVVLAYVNPQGAPIQTTIKFEKK